MKENGSSGKSAGKMTAHALDWWRESTAGKLVAPVTCALYEVFFLTRYVSTLPDGAVSTPTALLGLLALTTACTAGVFFRYRTALAPFVVVTLEAVLTLASDVTFLTIVPLDMALFALTARSRPSEAIAGNLLAAVAVLVRMLGEGPAGGAVVGEYVLALAAAGGLVSRMQHNRLEAAATVKKEQAARRAAERRGRIAGELHDSVGHDLTAIIALTEGLDGATGDELVDGAINQVNELARTGLADTRRAVAALGSPSATDVDDTELHDWSEIESVLANARSAGIACALTETGSRPDDPRQADLCFSLAREAITNAMRHGRDVTRIVASWDHGKGGEASVRVSDDGARQPGAEASHGTGLVRLRERIEAAGGSFSAGFEEGGWCVKANLPSMREEAG